MDPANIETRDYRVRCRLGGKNANSPCDRQRGLDGRFDLIAAFAVGGVYQSAAVSNGDSAGDNISSIASRAHYTCVGTELASTFS
jgi:hypothetical protein